MMALGAYEQLADGGQAQKVILVGSDYAAGFGGAAVEVFGTLAADADPAIAAAGDYAAGDILSQSATNNEGVAWVFDAVVGAVGGSGLVTRVTATFSVDALVPRLRLWLFNANPSASELDDNAAFSIAAADRTKLVGYVDLPALADGGAVSVAQNIDVRLPFVCAAADDALYGVLQTLDAFTNESAGMTATIALQVSRD